MGKHIMFDDVPATEAELAALAALATRRAPRTVARMIDVLRVRRGGSGDSETLRAIGSRWGVTKERVRQIEALGWRLLRLHRRSMVQ